MFIIILIPNKTFLPLKLLWYEYVKSPGVDFLSCLYRDLSPNVVILTVTLFKIKSLASSEANSLWNVHNITNQQNIEKVIRVHLKYEAIEYALWKVAFFP